MLNINIDFEKDAVSPKNKNGTFAINMAMTKSKLKSKSVKKPLNISLVVDTSYSMLENLNKKQFFNQEYANRKDFSLGINNLNGNGQILQGFPLQFQQQGKNKLELAKEMAYKILSNLNDGDIFSLIKFDEKAHVIHEAVVITENVKKQLMLSIANLNVGGNTNLYDGWELGAKEVAKFVSAKTLNRIIMLTDGQVNQGIQDAQEICKRVSAMTKANIQTSTVGIGEGFQENLLSKMAENGEGNFFFVEKDEDLSEMLKIELEGLASAGLTNVIVSFENKGTNNLNQLNGFKEENGSISVPNIRIGKENKLLVDFEILEKIQFTKTKSIKKYHLCDVVVKGVDIEGNKVEYKEELKINIISDDSYQSLPANGEISVEKVLINIANEQEKASNLILQGKSSEARKIMQLSAAMLRKNFAENQNASLMAANIEASLLKDDNTMSKTIRANSYSSRYGLTSD